MKTLFCLLTALAFVFPAFAGASDRPRPKVEDQAAKSEFERQGGTRHKWKKGQAHPESLAEAGLLADASLVWTGLYLDGGTKGYLFRDSAGKFLAVCTGPGFQSKDHPRRIDAAVGSRLFIGGLHYAKDEVEIVPAGSKAESFLRKLLAQSGG